MRFRTYTFYSSDKWHQLKEFLEKADGISCKWDGFMWGNNRGNFKVMNWVQKFTIVGRICTNMHANAVKQQFAVLSGECGPLMSPAVQNVIFSNRQQFDRCYTWRWHALLIRISLGIISCRESASKQTENTSGSQTGRRLEWNIILNMTLSIVPWKKQKHVLSFWSHGRRW